MSTSSERPDTRPGHPASFRRLPAPEHPGPALRRPSGHLSANAALLVADLLRKHWEGASPGTLRTADSAKGALERRMAVLVQVQRKHVVFEQVVL